MIKRKYTILQVYIFIYQGVNDNHMVLTNFYKQTMTSGDKKKIQYVVIFFPKVNQHPETRCEKISPHYNSVPCRNTFSNNNVK